ncbi:MAG: hypothetical protein ABIG88_01250 [Patescibacteria group bacterium]|nr:pilin [Patescibacteria group bacterium]
MKAFKIFFIIYLVIIIFVGANSVYAGIHTGPIVPCGGSGQSSCTLCHIWNLASNIINFISFNLAIPIATLLFVAAGIIFLTSAGNEQKVGLAKSIFTSTVIGLLIIFCSWLLIDTLMKTLVNPDSSSGTIIWAWNHFPSCSTPEL